MRAPRCFPTERLCSCAASRTDAGFSSVCGSLGQRHRRLADRPQAHSSADPEHFPEEFWGVEDPRITFVPELSKYAIVYTAYSRDGPGVALALTKDFHELRALGMIMPPEDKDAALLPRRIGGYWA